MPVIQHMVDFGAWATQHQTQVLYGMGGIVGVLLLGLLVCGRRKTGSPLSHGSARWATLREVRQAGLTAREGILLGRMGKTVLRAAQGHVLVCGPSNAGKDVGVNFPTTLRWPGSMVILDVKDQGENYTTCAAARPGAVWRFAPTMRQSHCLNILDQVRVGQPEEFRDVSVIIESHCAPRERQQVSTDSGQYFVRQAVLALRMVTLHVLYTQPRKSMAGVLAYMSNAGACIQSMCASAVQAVRQDGQRFLEMQKRAPKQFEGIWDSALGVLDIYRDPLVVAHTETSDFSLTDLAQNAAPQTLYLIANAPTEMAYLYPLFRATLQLFLHYRMERPRETSSQSHETLLLLNEFPTLGYMAPVEAAIAVARSYRLRFLLTIQDLGQLFRVYGHETPIWGNCAVKIFHPPVNDETALRMSRMLGPQTALATGESRTDGTGRRTRSMHGMSRPLLTEAEVLGLAPEVEIIWVQGAPHPILAEKLRYYADRF